MLKYVDAKVTFSEVPDEISLCIDFSNCIHKCKGCHSPYLQDNIGTELTLEKLKELIDKNNGISCVCLMGEGMSVDNINEYAKFVKKNYPYKVAWYTGFNVIPYGMKLDYFDYIKIGPYMKELGGLDSPTTNQRMYKIENITHEFQRNKP